MDYEMFYKNEIEKVVESRKNLDNIIGKHSTFLDTNDVIILGNIMLEFHNMEEILEAELKIEINRKSELSMQIKQGFKGGNLK